MARRQKAPTKEELIEKLTERVDESEKKQDKMLNKIRELEKKNENDLKKFREENESLLSNVKENVGSQTGDVMSKLYEIDSVKNSVEFLANRVNELSEKLYEFEQSKRNNLIFYGVPSEQRETPSILLQKVGLKIC